MFYWIIFIALGTITNGVISGRTPSSGDLLRAFTRLQPEGREQNRIAVLVEQTYREYVTRHSEENEVSFDALGLGYLCPNRTRCNRNARYRSFDGSCNNLRHPQWGNSFRAFARLLPNAYDDGRSTPRRFGVNGGVLPNPRVISTAIFPDIHREFDNLTLALFQWSQFTDHDLTLTATLEVNGSCCNNPDKACFPIEIPRNDSFYGMYPQETCIELTRSAQAPDPNCVTNNTRHPLNQLTAYMDASMVYGSSADFAHSLRSFQNGLLRNHISRNGQEFPLLDNNGATNPDPMHMELCHTNLQDENLCFVAGDPRVNEQPHLTTAHTMFLREHNRIAKELHRRNPSWNDERLFQESRRLVAAIFQHITMNEWAPIVLGTRFVKRFNLKPERNGYSYQYDPTIDATIPAEFASAAFRFGHTLIPGDITRFDRQYHRNGSTLLRQHFFRSFRIEHYDGLIRGQTIQGCPFYDNSITQEVTNHLYQTDLNPFGLDLMAINIQRGRDQGLRSYLDYRRLCNLQIPRTFQDLAPLLNEGVAEKLSRVYNSVEDIDLWPGGISEKSMPGALLGQTFGCIVATTLRRVKLGDRFWYENGNDVNLRFSRDQLRAIRKGASLARVICDNTEITRIQPNVYLSPNVRGNSRRSCSQIPSINLKHWSS